METDVPMGLWPSIRASLEAMLETHGGDIDAFLAAELRYASVDDMYKALGAEQVDVVALVLTKILYYGNYGVVNADMMGIGKGRAGAALFNWATTRGITPVFLR